MRGRPSNRGVATQRRALTKPREKQAIRVARSLRICSAMHFDSRRRLFVQLGLCSLVLLGCSSTHSDATTGAPTADGGAVTSDPGPPPTPTPGETPPTPIPLATNPAWIQGKPLDTWFAIPGTIHAGSPAAPMDDPKDIYATSNRRLAYSGMGLRGNEIILAANGGHGDYSGNEVTSIDLSADAPAWILRSAASPSPAPDVAYYSDGRPSSRHTYWSTIWNEKHNRLMLHYSRFVYGSAVSFQASNGFDLDTNTWDPAGTWSDGYSAGCADPDGNVYAMGVGYFTLKKWTAATDTWSDVMTYSDAINVNPVTFDSKRSHLFALAWGDGQGDGSSLSAFTIAGTTKTNITFEPSVALTQFLSDMPAYAGMEYDPLNDKYYFYEGAEGRSDRVYVITPNDGATWTIDILALGAGSVTPPTAMGSGMFNRFKYVTALHGFVAMQSGTSELFFLRTR